MEVEKPETKEEEAVEKADKKMWAIYRVLIVIIIVIIIVVAVIEKEKVSQGLKDFIKWVKEHPTAGPFALCFVYVVCSILFIPGSILTLGAGLAFKQAYQSTWHAVLVGFLAVWIGASTGSIIAMLLGRFVFKEWVTKQAEKYPIIEAINYAIETEGLKLILLVRLCPIIPFNILNYLMGITGITLRDFILGSLGMIPGTLVYVFIGSTISDIADVASGKSKDKDGQILVLVLVIVGSILACGGIIWVSVVAKRKLNELTEAAMEKKRAAESINGKGQEILEINDYEQK